MAKPQGDGSPLRDHVEDVEDRYLPAAAIDLLDREHVPARASHLWPIFNQLNAARRSGFNGAEAIGFDQLIWWQQLYRRKLRTWEIDALLAVDAKWLKVIDDKPDKKKDEESDDDV